MLNETPFESVAAAHGICVKTLRRRCDRLKLAYQRYGKRYAFTPTQLLAYQQAHTVAVQPVRPRSRRRRGGQVLSLLRGEVA